MEEGPKDFRLNSILVDAHYPSVRIMKKLIKSNPKFLESVQKVEGLIDMGKGFSVTMITDNRLIKLSKFIMQKAKDALYGQDEMFQLSIKNKTGITSKEIEKEGMETMMKMSENPNVAPDKVIANKVYQHFDIVLK
jgi:hypothetical protein